MVLFSAVALGLIIGAISGGSFSGFATAASRFRFLPVIILAALTQVVIFTGIAGRTEFVHDFGPYIYMATILASLFVMAMNLHIPGMKVIMAGAALNALVIFVNGGYMPAPESALHEAGRYEDLIQSEQEVAEGERLVHTNTKIVDDNTGYLIDPDAPLLFLGDVIGIPDGIPAANVISFGDILIALGAAIAVVRVMHLPVPKESGADEQSPAEHPAS